MSRFGPHSSHNKIGPGAVHHAAAAALMRREASERKPPERVASHARDEKVGDVMDVLSSR